MGFRSVRAAEERMGSSGNEEGPVICLQVENVRNISQPPNRSQRR